MREHGFTDEGVGACAFNPDSYDHPHPDEFCLYTVRDGQYCWGASMSPSLAETLTQEESSFLEDPQFDFQMGSFTEAQELEAVLRTDTLDPVIRVFEE